MKWIRERTIWSEDLSKEATSWTWETYTEKKIAIIQVKEVGLTQGRG